MLDGSQLGIALVLFLRQRLKFACCVECFDLISFVLFLGAFQNLLHSATFLRFGVFWAVYQARGWAFDQYLVWNRQRHILFRFVFNVDNLGCELDVFFAIFILILVIILARRLSLFLQMRKILEVWIWINERIRIILLGEFILFNCVDWLLGVQRTLFDSLGVILFRVGAYIFRAIRLASDFADNLVEDVGKTLRL